MNFKSGDAPDPSSNVNVDPSKVKLASAFTVLESTDVNILLLPEFV